MAVDGLSHRRRHIGFDGHVALKRKCFGAGRHDRGGSFFPVLSLAAIGYRDARPFPAEGESDGCRPV
ncbi:MAG: hypothetical protein E5Y61_11005 [Mesorhizobium sp.]|nr:MAG: hypothetical protein E5Y61_11005 [Mesorhizobium sp.]